MYFTNQGETMKLNPTILILAALFALALPAMAQDAPSVPPAQPALSVPQLDSPACPGSAPALPGVDAPPVVPMIGDGGRTCSAFLPDGSPNPDWPDCNSSDGGSLPGPSCDGIGMCYCFCRYYHRCDQDPNECDPLAQCLNDCDAEYPGCPYPGGTYPSSIGECL
jgi:hypothetical protein